MRDVLLLLAAAAVIFCTAINAYTWCVAYPLWGTVDRESFRKLHAEYLRRLGPVITLPHIVMFFATGALLRWQAAAVPLWSAVLLFVLAAAVVGLSAGVAGPVHDRFTRTGECDPPGLRRLAAISASRSILMLAASGLAGWMVWLCMSRG